MQLRMICAAATTVGVVATGMLAGTAAAGSSAPCNASPVFAPWGDTANYVKMTAVGSESLSLGADGSASFKAGCVHFLEPQIRLFAINLGSPAASLRVSVQYKDTSNVNHDQTIGSVSGLLSPEQPSPSFSFDSSQLKGNVQVTLTATGSDGDWVVYAVYIDPFCAR